MTGCDFQPVTPEQLALDVPAKPAAKTWDQRQRTVTLHDHHVRVEPAKGARWLAWTYEPIPGWERPTKALSHTPREALQRLCPGTPWPPWPHWCAVCDDPNTVVMDSPKGSDQCRWYCPDHEPRPPRRPTNV